MKARKRACKDKGLRVLTRPGPPGAKVTMPGSVQNAAPTTVLPWSLCKTFVHRREFAVIVNEYKNGEFQRSRQVETSRKSWQTERRLTPAVLAEFRAFYDARIGQTDSFYFYEPSETNPKFSYDPTGQALTGRHVVRFEGSWEQMVEIGRADVDIELIELA